MAAELPALQQGLDAYLDLAPEHLSCYGLTAEPGTPFQARVAAGELTLPDEEDYAAAFLMIDEWLGQVMAVKSAASTITTAWYWKSQSKQSEMPA